MDMIFREYGRVIWQKKGWFALVLLGLTSATVLDFYLPVLYKNIANELAVPYTESKYQILLNQLSYVAICYGCIWLSWRVLEIGIIPLEGGGTSLLEKRCFNVLKKQKYSFFENSFSGSLIKQANRFHAHLN